MLYVSCPPTGLPDGNSTFVIARSAERDAAISTGQRNAPRFPVISTECH
ncbi:MAG: hypothetical protein LBL66_03325 [Clostridiales bacterium]|nr:hypothetical protein [Clostridiales bacterium]